MPKSFLQEEWPQTSTEGKMSIKIIIPGEVLNKLHQELFMAKKGFKRIRKALKRTLQPFLIGQKIG